MSDKSNSPARPLIGFITRDNAPQIIPAPISREWMSEMSDMRKGWPNRCLPMLIANQSGWELRNRCGFTATWFGQQGDVDVMIRPISATPVSSCPPAISVTVSRPGICRCCSALRRAITCWSADPQTIRGCRVSVRGHGGNRLGKREFQHELEIHPQTDAGAIEVDEPIYMVVPQRRAELEEFAPELRRIESDEDLQRKHALFLHERGTADQFEAAARVAAGQQPEWHGDYTQGKHRDGEPGTPDHQTRRHLRSFVQPQHDKQQ